jgi:hypothetical protein
MEHKPEAIGFTTISKATRFHALDRRDHTEHIGSMVWTTRLVSGPDVEDQV